MFLVDQITRGHPTVGANIHTSNRQDRCILIAANDVDGEDLGRVGFQTAQPDESRRNDKADVGELDLSCDLIVSEQAPKPSRQEGRTQRGVCDGIRVSENRELATVGVGQVVSVIRAAVR